jgi:hypothetical protein
VSLGAIRDFAVSRDWSFGVGALYAFDAAPSGIPSYGGGPHGTMVFARIKAG